MSRISRRSLLALIGAGTSGLFLCRRIQAAQLTSWTASRFFSKAASSELRALANDGAKDRSVRAKAVFSLFASHIHPPADDKTAGDDLGSAPWLAECQLEGVHAIGGHVPLEWREDESLFSLRLFPNRDGQSDWCIYFTLSGGRGKTVPEASDFLAGRPGKASSQILQIREFALCQVEKRKVYVERFSPNGIKSLGPF